MTYFYYLPLQGPCSGPSDPLLATQPPHIRDVAPSEQHEQQQQQFQHPRLVLLLPLLHGDLVDHTVGGGVGRAKGKKFGENFMKFLKFLNFQVNFLDNEERDKLDTELVKRGADELRKRAFSLGSKSWIT